MNKDARENITIKEMSVKKSVLEKAINDLLLSFEKEVGLPVVDVSVEIHYPVDSEETEPNFSRTIDVCIAL